MFHYWGYLLFGFIFMLGYALFSGISITMVIPLFDYVFLPRQTETTIRTFGIFFNSLRDIVADYFASTPHIFSVPDTSTLAPYVGQLKDLLSRTDPLLLLYTICVGVIVLTIIKNLFFYGNKIMFANLHGKTIIDVRNHMFEKYLRQSLKFFNVNKVGDSIVRMISDVNIISTMYIDQIFNVLRDIILMLVYAQLAITINARLFLISLTVLPVITLMMSFLGKKIKKYAKRIQRKFSDMFSNIEEVLNNMRIVKAFAREDAELEKFQIINRKHFSYWLKAAIYSSINTPLGEFNGTMVGLLVVILGGRLVLSENSSLSFGSFSAFLFAIFSMLHPTKTIIKAYTEIKRAKVSLDRIFEIIDQESEIIDSPDAISKTTFDSRIVFEQVNFSYDEQNKVLQDINLTIEKGERIAFVGSSGSGKTTLVNLLPRMYDVTSGSITIDGIDVKDIKLRDLRLLFGTVTQDSILFSDTIANNIKYGSLNEVSDETMMQAANISYADEFIEQFPKSYQTLLYQKGANLSGGQKQRLCIARAIVGDPPILIFDEATSALDTESEKKVQLAIEHATENRTVIVIAHRLSTILASDKIVVMDKGHIVGLGSHRDLLNTCPRYKTLYDLQFNDYDVIDTPQRASADESHD